MRLVERWNFGLDALEELHEEVLDPRRRYVHYAHVCTVFDQTTDVTTEVAFPLPDVTPGLCENPID